MHKIPQFYRMDSTDLDQLGGAELALLPNSKMVCFYVLLGPFQMEIICSSHVCLVPSEFPPLAFSDSPKTCNLP